ncbi:LacI family DNA-binding transcriptional regulator [Variovorax sp. LT1R16]|uniref:LacI family DNA-binding transcriptional regulator n=1 Tax=Variovorax sp. LT1R16 TaxID=3443728 RepID=UPI003F45ECC5
MNIQIVAERAGVSVATVSRAFNFPDKVAPATRALVERVAKELGYLPNASARTLRTQRSRVLGVVLPTLLNPTFAECLQGIAEAAAAGGYAIIPVTTGYEVDEEQRSVHQLLAGNVDGMILVVSNPSSSVALQRLHGAAVPYVLAYNRHPAHPCVSVDSERASAEVVDRLVRLGHRRIAMVSGTLAASDRSQQRYRGYLQGMADAGLDALPLLEVPFVETAVEAVRHYLEADPRPSALFCSNDLLAIRCIRAAHRNGLRVPQDLAVVGFDGIALGEDLTPALSTVTQPNHDIGRHAVELLVKALAAGTAPGADASLLLPHAFREGESYAAAPT